MSIDPEIANAIISTTAERGPDKSVCPSEIARMLFPDNWRLHMDAVMEVAITLQKQGKVVITQGGQAIDVQKIKGPIRIKIR